MLVLIACTYLAYREGVYVTEPLHAHESVLKKDLQTLREAIDNCTLDRQQAPNSLEDLVDSHYIREIPVEPITRQTDCRWVLYRSQTILPSDRLLPEGVDDVHSASTNIARDATLYDTW